jgi:large subunit ribosomal protein L22
MGVRKRETAEARKAAKANTYLARLRNCPTSPRKMRVVADLVRGENVDKAAGILQFSKQDAARRLEKLLLSALHNYEQKSGESWEGANLYVKEIMVDSGRMLKRIQPAPQGRAHRIRKRSNHVTLILDTKSNEQES